ADSRAVHVRGEWDFSESFAYGRQCWLRTPIPARNAEIPVFNVIAPSVPLVGPRKHKGTCAASRKRRSNLPGKGVRLRALALSTAVQADLSHDQWSVTRDVLQAGEISFEAGG